MASLDSFFDGEACREAMINIISFEEVDSTNNVAAELIAGFTDVEDSLVLAGTQTAGRGRLNDRTWVSMPGNFHGTYIINVEKLGVSENSVALLNRAAILAVRDEFLKLKKNDSGITIKLPNDILINKKKVAGVLIEVSHPFALIGIGINLSVSPMDFTTDIKKEFNVLVNSRELGQNLYISLIKRIADERK